MLLETRMKHLETPNMYIFIDLHEFSYYISLSLFCFIFLSNVEQLITRAHSFEIC